MHDQCTFIVAKQSDSAMSSDCVVGKAVEGVVGSSTAVPASSLENIAPLMTVSPDFKCLVWRWAQILIDTCVKVFLGEWSEQAI